MAATLEKIITEEKPSVATILVLNNPAWTNPKNHLLHCDKPTLIQLTPLQQAEEQFLLQQQRLQQTVSMEQKTKEEMKTEDRERRETPNQIRQFSLQSTGGKHAYLPPAAFQAGCSCGAEITIVPQSSQGKENKYTAANTLSATAHYEGSVQNASQSKNTQYLSSTNSAQSLPGAYSSPKQRLRKSYS